MKAGNSIALSPELAASLSQCKPGHKGKKLILNVDVTKNDESGFEATVNSATVEYDEKKKKDGEGEETTKAPKKSSKPPAVAMAYGGDEESE